MKIFNPIYRFLVLGILSLAFLFQSCSKEDNDEPTTKTELLTRAAWKLTAQTVDPGFPIYDDEWNVIGTETDLFASMEDCDKDDYLQFNPDYTMVTDAGLTKCESGDQQKYYGGWSFNTDETTLTLTEDLTSITVTLVELTQTVLKVKLTDIDGSETYIITTTFSH